MKKRLTLTNTQYQQALDYLYSFVDYEKEPRPRDPSLYDLRRVDELLDRLGNPHLKSRTVHIAGSKGKGSVAAMIAAVLSTAGYTTGLFTSPHLHTFSERIRVNGNLIANNELISLVNRLRPHVKAVNDKATYGLLTTYELTAALGFAYFEQKDTDFQVIEVGMGGRLDATNVVQPDVCVITSISYDHMESLGDTLTQITTEKAGIIKPGSVVVTSPQKAEANRVIKETCRTHQVKLIKIGSDVTWQALDHDTYQQSLEIQGRCDIYCLTIPLLGQHQLENAATAVAALEVLIEMGFSITKDSIIQGLATVDWPGRLQVIKRNPFIVVDGAHNADSAIKLRQALEQDFDFDRAILIIGILTDKDLPGIVYGLTPLFNEVIGTHPDNPRAMPVESIVTEFRRHGVIAQPTEDMATALTRALSQASEKDLICVTGSLSTVANAMTQIEKLGL